METSSFILFDNNTSGLLLDESNHPKFPIRYYNVIDGEGFKPKKNHSYFGYIYKGGVNINFSDLPNTHLKSGQYFVSNSKLTILKYMSGKAIIIEIIPEKEYKDYKAFFSIGGKIEAQGRLKYIDGCTDSLLIPPVKMGDPCFNHLHFPTNIDQTQHTHPSHRIGVVAKGSGRCITPFGNLPLDEGNIFIIKEWDGVTTAVGQDGGIYPIGQHAFETRDSSMDVIAFHPDSDFGATDEVHPMINRTIVDGVSASLIKEIQTK
jgi:hypothetical protein